ncbi:deacetylase Atu3266-like [Tigriopus californicus]|nr:deacetylase Atu3266-like [Tigriopus californicus]XP_059096881.1 deacetylase Atu3266-like [Tigriopus californicus]|eukprot:TCALIF_09627-PA protein Name:"Similar to Atu3266 Deacetylase Atu3266 (Agrobacterium tumefaciens (strain C58 / ATCC 33970))" AED:0.00 eAED:0.00 QI:16/1/1/1/1/1/5/44/408
MENSKQKKASTLARMDFDLIIKNGHVLDLSSKINKVMDLAILHGEIVASGKEIQQSDQAHQVLDVSGHYVSAGWIDLHTHVYEHATILGVNPDICGLQKGVTTMVDGGSSGAMTFAGLRKFIVEPSETRVLAFLHIACHGLAGAACSGNESGGESDHLNAIKQSLCVQCVKDNPDIIVGIKVRLDKSITNNGATEHETYARALWASKEAQVPLMVHHTNSSIPLGSHAQGVLSCPGSLRKGDIYTHTYHGHPSSILDHSALKLHPSAKAAQDKGVIMDVGHGQGSFDWLVAKKAASENLWPDTISTDLHSGNVNGTAQSLPYVMSKFLALGMPLQKIVCAVTSTPAKCINRDKEFGRIANGLCADLTIFKVESKLELAYDASQKSQFLKEQFIPKIVIREGRVIRLNL